MQIFQIVNLRVEVFDYDLMSSMDLIEQLECVFEPEHVGEDAERTIWSPRLDCEAIHQRGKHK
jgi:hypothetical protein